MSEEWKNLTNGSFKGVPFHVAIPSKSSQFGVESEEMTIERRLQFIKRPLIDGAPVRDWGSDPETFVAVLEFFGDDHAKNAEAFLDVLNQGTPGQLILPTIPKAVQAYFWKRTRSTHFRDGNSVRVTVTWAAANEIQASSPGLAQAVDLSAPSIDQSKSVLDSAVDAAATAITNNPFIQAIQTVQTTLSTARRAVNAVLTLERGVQSKIQSLVANIQGTLALIKQATNEIQKTFSPTASLFEPAATALGTNSQTGQVITDFSEPDVIPVPPSPLAPPSGAVKLPVPSNLNALPGVSNFGTSIDSSLSSNRDDLNSNSVGRTEDVSRAITAVLNALSDYIGAVVSAPPAQFVVPFDMSLGEVLFINGIDLIQLRTLHKANPQVSDTFVVPKGTVITL